MVGCEGFVAFSKTEVEQSIPDRFFAQVRHHGDCLAVRATDRDFTYAELDRESNRVANAILALRGDAAEPVILLLSQGAALVAAILGVLKAGKFYVPQDAALDKSSIRRVIEESGAFLVLTDQNNRRLANELAGSKRTVLDIEQLKESLSTDAPGLSIAPDFPAYIYFTSGSTGRPKGVVDNHRNVLHNIMRYTNSLEIGPNDRLSLLQASYFSGAVSSLFCALLNGAAVFPFDLRKAGTGEMRAWVKREKLTMFHSVPVIFEQLVSGGNKFPHLRVIRLEGDQTLVKHVHLFQQRFDRSCQLVNGLGTTETGLVRQFFIGKGTELPTDSVPIGYPVEDMEIGLLDDAGEFIENGAIGEIVVRSRFLATGYWQRGDLTASAFANDPEGGDYRMYRTRDMGRFLADGCLVYCGRKDFQIKFQGQRIDPTAIESALMSIPGITDAVVTVSKGKIDVGEQLVAYVVTADDRSPTTGTLRSELSGLLSNHSIPRRYVILDDLPRDSNGKVSRRALPSPGRERPSLDADWVEPETPLEKLVVNCFSEVLGIDGIGLHDSFHDLGGDSLRAVTLASIVEKKFSRRVPTELLMSEFTVSKLCELVQSQERSECLVPLNNEGTESPLFLFHSYNGFVLDYRNLAAQLHINRPIFGIEFTGKPDGYPVDSGLEELASYYLESIREIQPCGPYLLGGQCFGGLIALEVTQQLRRQGEKTDRLLLIDTPLYRGYLARMTGRFSSHLDWLLASSVSPAEKISYIVTRLKSAGEIVMMMIWRRLHLRPEKAVRPFRFLA